MRAHTITTTKAALLLSPPALGALGLVACGGGDDDEANTGSETETPDSTEARLSPEQKIEQTGNKWAPAFAAGFHFARMTQLALERITCKRIGGPIRNCTPPSSAFRKSFQHATVQETAIKGDKAAARFSNGETIELVHVSGRGWLIHRIGGNAGDVEFITRSAKSGQRGLRTTTPPPVTSCMRNRYARSSLGAPAIHRANPNGRPSVRVPEVLCRCRGRARRDHWHQGGGGVLERRAGGVHPGNGRAATSLGQLVHPRRRRDRGRGPDRGRVTARRRTRSAGAGRARSLRRRGRPSASAPHHMPSSGSSSPRPWCPTSRTQIDELRALTSPEDQAEEIEGWLDNAEAGLDELETDPVAGFTQPAANPFADVNREAAELGIGEC